MSTVELFGWLAATFMLLSFVCRDPLCIRTLTVLAHLAFIACGWTSGSMPMLALHVVLLPINGHRLVVALRQSSAGVAAAGADVRFGAGMASESVKGVELSAPPRRLDEMNAP